MPFKYTDHKAAADVAFEAWGESLSELFKDAAEATLAVMIGDLNAILPKVERDISLCDEALDFLLYEWLQELIYLKDAERLLLRPLGIEVSEDSDLYRLKASVRGEEIDPERHELLVDVKAVTFHNLAVYKSGETWIAKVVLDI